MSNIPTTSRESRPSQIFWKLFAIAALAGALYLGYEGIIKWNALRAMSMKVSSQRIPPDPYPLLQIKDNQVRPASVVLIDNSTPAVGYVSDVTDDFVILGTVYKEDSREERVLIPWDKVLYIRMHLKQSDAP